MNHKYSNEFIINIMERAIELSKRGRGNVSPNPLVGCVIVKDGKIIGEGYHEKYGGNHAEKNAIENCIEDPVGSSAFVTLEPCCHHGKTPPCTDVILESGIKKVVIAQRDVNPLVAGKGVQILQDSGVEVIEDVCNDEAKWQIRFFRHWMEKKQSTL